MSLGSGGRDQRGQLARKAPDLAVRCPGAQESVLASGRRGSWKQKWGKSDLDISSEPVRNITKMKH